MTMAEHLAFESLVEAYLLARNRGDSSALERLVDLHPEHEHALTAFALLDAAVPARPQQAVLQSAQAAVTPALRARAMAAAFGTGQEIVAIAGILARAQELRLSGRDLARVVDLPRDVLLQLDRRLITVASVPRKLLVRLADALQTSADSLQAFLSGSGPAVPVAAYHYAGEAPRSGEPASFAEALAASDLATPEQRATWGEALREEGLA
jgi:hypothetical protein